MTPEVIFGQHIPPGGELVQDAEAVGWFAPVDAARWEVHYAASPGMRGRMALAAFRRLLTTFWATHELVQELFGVIDTDNAPARHLAVLIGFSRCGTYIVPWPDGIVRTTVLYKMARPNE